MDEMDPELEIPCPYDSAHMIRAKRMQMHIYDCRKNRDLQGRVNCPFNASHVVYEAERRYHMMMCQDRHQVHSRLVQETSSLPENRGCVETPAYRPLPTFGDSWEVPDRQNGASQSWSAPIERKPEVEVTMTEEETRGLNARQRRQLYLRKKAELEEAAKRKAQAPPPTEPVRTQNPSMGGSRSMALFQQQSKKTEHDIYQEALKKPMETNHHMAIGRGYGATDFPTNPGSLGRGRGGRALANSNMAPSLPTAIGRGRGAATLALSSMDREDNVGTNIVSEGNAMNLPGRGAMMRGEFPPVAPGRGAGAWPPGIQGMRPGVQGPQGAWPGVYGPGGAAPMTTGAFGRGGGMASAVDSSLPSAGVPFGGMTSQPDALTPVFQHMAIGNGGGRGRGISIANFEPGNLNNNLMTESSESDDPERFVDAVPWVGSGYQYNQAVSGYTQPQGPDPACPGIQPFTSGSSISLGSNPAAVASWAAEMEREEYGSAVSMSESASIDSDSSRAQDSSQVMVSMDVDQVKADLKKVEKKLRQIAELETKKNRGRTLDGDQEGKLKKKEEYEREASKLREFLNKKGSK